ncbi:BspA family leucine-rich repeat surface protein [Prevotella communis]|uniref:BspA family leucine-rich repeat surface protein n=1 Tax=Prevotella communis TaxID=2913614 RepID=UPI001EDC7162|nr:BspA family leucine-rich repeat surface protein [Prevotella communis]UKK56706.1 BspA family leucine-rich repeat surface protein [Prevotella communis]
MKRKLFSLLVLLMTAVSGAWAADVLNIVVEGTSATIMYDGNASNNPYFGGDEWKQSEFPWDDEHTTRPTITTVTIDGSCKNFSGTSLRNLFIGFSGLTTINGLDNLNTANVQNMEYMFADCSSLTSLDLSSFNTASLVTMYNMFAYCSKLTSLDLSSWNTENVEMTSSMFADCSKLTSLDLSSWNTAKVWNTSYMFYNCSKLENIYVGDGWSTAAVTMGDDMFDGCTKLLSMNTANPATNKTNANTGDGGYLKVKPAGDYLFTVAPCEHGSGTVKFFVNEKEVKGANEGDLVTMTVTPDEGYVVGSVSANAYTTWAGARRTAPAAIPMLGNVTLTPVESKANTWTFTMPAANVELKIGYLVTSNLYLSKEALADKANITVKDGETTVEFDDDGKSKTTVIEGRTVTTKYNGTKKIIGMKVEKKEALLTLSVCGETIYYAEGETWAEAIQNHPTENQGWEIYDGDVTHENLGFLKQNDDWVPGTAKIDPNASYDYGGV